MFEKINQKLNNKKKFSLLGKIKCVKNKKFQAEIFASLLAVEAFSDYLEKKGISVSRENGLCNALQLIEELNIADIRTKNNVVIDVRTILGDEYPQICIPRGHFSEEFRPDIYVGVRIDKNFEMAEFIGCVKADDVPRTKGNENYFVAEAGELSSIEDIEKIVNSIEVKGKQYIALDHEKAANLFLSFIDKTISEENKRYLISHLASCNECKAAFINLCNLDRSLNSVKNKLLLDEDYTLRLFSGDPVLAGDEEIEIDIPEEKTKEEVIEDLQEEEIPENIPEEEEIIAEEPEVVEEDKDTTQKEASKRKNPIDWADQLVNNAPEREPQKENSLFEESSELQTPKKDDDIDIFINEESLSPSAFDDNALDENQFFDEHKLSSEESVFALDETEETLIKSEKLKDEPEKIAREVVQDISEKEKVKPFEQKDEALENILETLNDVEIINEEDDIDSLLSFFDHDGEKEPLSSNSGQAQFAFSPEPPRDKPSVVAGNKEPTIKEAGDYATVLGSTSSDENDVIDILLYEERDIEEISQEDLLNIFETDSAHNKDEEQKEKAVQKFSIKPFLKDKKVVALTATIALSATILLLSLGQFDKPIEISKTNQNNNSSNNQVNNIVSIKSLEERTRQPLTFYTRDIVKTVKYKKKIAKKPAKYEEEQVIISKQEEKKPEFKEINIKNVSWELSASVMKEPKIKKYFLDAGYELKKHLSKNLYIPELEVKNAKIDIFAELDMKGNIINSRVFRGSGSKEVDKICLESLTKIIKGNPFPKVVLNGKKIKLKLLISI